MVTDNELSDYYDAKASGYHKALDDVIWDLQQFMAKAPNPVQRAFNNARITRRVKPLQSYIRKCKRDNVDVIEDIPEKLRTYLASESLPQTKKQQKSSGTTFKMRKLLTLGFVKLKRSLILFLIPSKRRTIIH